MLNPNIKSVRVCVCERMCVEHRKYKIFDCKIDVIHQNYAHAANNSTNNRNNNNDNNSNSNNNTNKL